VVFKVGGESTHLPAFDARLKLLCVESGVDFDCEEQHAAGLLHYDLKVQGGIPFPPFVLASGEFPQLAIEVEWVDAGSGVRGTAKIAGGKLEAQNVENVGGDADRAVTIRTGAVGTLALALVAIRTGHDECRGYMLTANEDALFRIARDPGSGAIELYATHGAAEWCRAWRLSADVNVEYREINPAQPIADADFQELDTLAREFVAQWIWFSNDEPHEIAIEAERYARLGYAVSDANLRSVALHRIKDGAAAGDGGIHYSTLEPAIAWIEGAIARCWPGNSVE
jgi:hypothetical protein